MKSKWFVFSISGLIFFGLGLSLLGEAIILKYNNEPFFWYGTFALVVIISGLCLFGNAVRYRILMDTSS